MHSAPKIALARTVDEELWRLATPRASRPRPPTCWSDLAAAAGGGFDAVLTPKVTGPADLDPVPAVLAEAIRHALSRWEGLARFTGDGRIELDSNTVERAVRPLALNRKNSLFAGSDGGGEHWAVLASLVETCKLNNLKAHAYLADVLTRLVNGHPNNRIDDLLPWVMWPENTAYRKRRSLVTKRQPSP